MGQYGNQPDFGTRAVAITPKGFAGGGYVNVLYQDSDDFTQNVYLTSTNLNTSIYNNNTPIPKATTEAEWTDYTENQNIGCWAYYDFEDSFAKFGKVYNTYAVQNLDLYPAGYSLLQSSIANLMTNDYGYNNTLGTELKSIQTGTLEQDINGTTLWTYNAPENIGTNNFGFTGIPGGYYHGRDESWNDVNYNVRIWDDGGNGEYYQLGFKDPEFIVKSEEIENGYYVRLQVDPGDKEYVAPQPLNSAALYVGTGGDLIVTIVGSEVPVTFKNVPDASFLPIIVSNVWERGDDGFTTASDIIAIY